MSQTFFSKSLSALGIKVAAAGLSFVMFVALAQALTQHEFGQFGFAFSLATFLAVLGALGQRNLVLRFVSIYQQDHRPAAIYGVISRGYRHVLFGSVILALGLAGFSLLPIAADQRGLLLATACLVPLLSLGEFQPNPHRALGSVWIALLPRDILLRVGMIVIAISSVAARFTAEQAIWSMSVLLAILILMQALSQPFTSPFRLLRERKDVVDQPKWDHAMWGLWGNSVLNASGRNVAMILIAVMVPALSAGAFFAALRTSMVLELFLLAINIVAAPLLAGGLHRNDLAQVQALCRKICIMIGVPTAIAFLVLVFAGDRILLLFGPGYDAAHTELIILATGYLVSAWAGPTAQLMEMGGFERMYFRMLATTTAVSFLSLPIAVLLYGSIGGAVCIAGNLIALNVWAYIFIHRHIGVSAGLLSLGKRTTQQEVTP